MEYQEVRYKKRKRDTHDGKTVLPRSAQNSIHQLFEKKVTYTPQTEIPDLSENLNQRWSIDRYMELKKTLNDLKTNLNDKDMISWHEHTRGVNPAAKIAPELRHQVSLV